MVFDGEWPSGDLRQFADTKAKLSIKVSNDVTIDRLEDIPVWAGHTAEER
jgi:hypothetical protein